MLFGDVIAIALSIIGFLLSIQGLWLVSSALWPRRVEIATNRCGTGNLKCFLVGIPVTLLGAIFAALISRAGTFGQLSAFAIALLYLVYANVGAAGLVTHIGRRLSSPADADRPWKATVRGGIVLEFAWLLPIVGWLGLLPITLIVGAGAMTLSFFGSGEQTEMAGARPVSAFAPEAPTAPPLPRAPRLRPIPLVESEARDLELVTPAGVER